MLNNLKLKTAGKNFCGYFFLLSILSLSLINKNIFAKSDTLAIKNNDVTIVANKIESTIKIDGLLDEEIWKSNTGFENFIQKDPIEGASASEKTILKLAYDNDALYIGAKMYDSHPDSIIARLARRDEWTDADYITIYLDPYDDKRSGYYFNISAAGGLIDGILYNDTWDDESWDGVWEGKAHKDSEGWTAEMRIPFSQLRFHERSEMIWGINFKRNIERRNEFDYLVFIPKKESGFVSHFANLTGINNIKGGGKIELTPYLTFRSEFLQHEEGDPFNDGSKYIPGAGVDFKLGVGSNLNLNATINPDFGQVEIDPAVINLSDVETYFDEKRPFFLEGSKIFDFGVGGAHNYWGFNWSGVDFFYSRRIGRPAQGSIPDDVDYSISPTGTHILAAGKLTGKIGETWNVGTIQNITNREYAKISVDGKKSEAEVEPLSYYGIFRAQNEINGGQQGIGFMSTLAYRDFKDNRLSDEINKDAFSFGIDGWTFLDSSQTWVFAGWTGLSRISGNHQRIIDVQENSLHYFQRPDEDHINVDSSITSLTGYAGRVFLNKQKGNFFVNTSFGFITPSFDVNDLGFQGRSDKINWHAGAGYYWSDVTKFYRYLELGAAVYQNHDFNGTKTWEGIFHFGNLNLLNYYSIDWDLAYNPKSFNNTRTRGGPLTLNKGGYQADISINSDSRKDWIIGLSSGIYQGKPSYNWYVGTDIELRILPNLSLSFSPQYSRDFEDAQYVNTFSDSFAINTYGKRYVFAVLDQKTLSASLRINWIFTPQISLQFYLQPLISSGKYTNFKELAKPKTYDFNIYGENGSTFDEQNYVADPDGSGPAQQIEIDNPNFNVRSLRGNAVLRWEYLPGSVLYFVWTQTRSHSEDYGDFRFGESIDNLVTSKPDNIFLIKATYWMNL